jgi:hypothetical protein
MELNDPIHAIIGRDEVGVIGTALGMLLSKVNLDLSSHVEETEKDRAEYLAMLSVKLCAEKMFTDIWLLLGMDEAQISVLLRDTEWLHDDEGEEE